MPAAGSASPLCSHDCGLDAFVLPFRHSAHISLLTRHSLEYCAPRHFTSWHARITHARRTYAHARARAHTTSWRLCDAAFTPRAHITALPHAPHTLTRTSQDKGRNILWRQCRATNNEIFRDKHVPYIANVYSALLAPKRYSRDASPFSSHSSSGALRSHALLCVHFLPLCHYACHYVAYSPRIGCAGLLPV